MFISHTGPDSGHLVAWLRRELTAVGLRAFLDEKGIPAGAKWAEQIRQALGSCRVFIVLVSPGFFLRQWPVLELRTALRRAAQTPAAVTIMPLYVRWTCSQAAQTLQQAAAAGSSHICSGFTRANGDPVEGAFWQQPASTSGQQPQQPAAQAWALLQQLQRFQQANAQRTYLEHYKDIEVQAVEELVREALCILPRRDFEVPPGVSSVPAGVACLPLTHKLPTTPQRKHSLLVVVKAWRLRIGCAAGIVGRDHLTGLLEEKLQAAPHGCLGLWGMRGLGKSTLAKALCSSLQRRFPGRTCLLSFPSLEQAAQGLDVQQLQEQLFKDALRMLSVRSQDNATAEQASLRLEAV